jgi:hypothetical protein
MNETTIPVPPSGGSAAPSAPLLCPACHQPVRPEYYFCPNCGKNLKEPPFSVSVGAQITLYTMSVVTPLMCFLTIGSWKGMKYLKSEDPRAKQIGMIALAIMAVTTVVMIWAVIVLTEQLVGSLSGGLLGGSGSDLNF